MESWRPEVERFDRQRWPSRLGSDLSESLVRGDHNNIERLIREAIKSGDGRVFKELMTYMTTALRRVVGISLAREVDYLWPMVDIARTGQVVIATLNYDRAIELACQAGGVSYSTGIESWSESGKLTFATSGLSLLKLHGSIDWWIETEKPSTRQSICRWFLLWTVGWAQHPLTLTITHLPKWRPLSVRMT